MFRSGVVLLVWICMGFLFVGTATAGNGMTLVKQPRESLQIPQWLYLFTGGAAIGASALLASFVTDRKLIRNLHNWSFSLTAIKYRGRQLRWIGAGIGFLMLVLTIFLGYTGPELPTASFSILVTFVLVRAGLPMLSYLVGNTWPVLNPWRAIANVLPTGFRTYPESLHRWPAVVGVLSLVWIEVIFPVSTVPSVLATAIVLYSVVTLAGAVLYGPESWFENADPLAVLFDFFGTVAPIQRQQGSLRVKLPGSELTDPDVVTDTSDVAFIIALVWELTYSGFITTQAGVATIKALVTGLPLEAISTDVRAVVVYTVLYLVGFGGFFAAYWYAGQVSRQTTGTYITAHTIALRFAPPLLAIAAGYHLAHYTGLFTTLLPALGMALLSPFSPPANPLVLSTPSWFEGLSIAFVLLGHLLAIWAAHAMAFDLFDDRLVAIRSQYPFVAVMMGYTVISLWILSLPDGVPPYLA